MHQLRNKDLEPVMARLDRAISNHRQWVRALMKTMVCSLAHTEQDMRSDAHRLCEFGKWYYGAHPQSLVNDDVFKAIEAIHMEMHRLACRILTSQKQGEAVSEAEFDAFYGQLDDFVCQVETLKGHLQKLVFNRDPLTGAFNRAALVEELGQVHHMVLSQVDSACVVMMDIDYFKSINDEFGHAFGDKVLKSIAGFIHNHLRSFDKLFRYGGEEFLLTLINTSVESATAIAQRIREGVGDLTIYHGGRGVQITASFGVAVVEPGVEAKVCLDRADKALYRAKRNGRNRVEVWRGDS